MPASGSSRSTTRRRLKLGLSIAAAASLVALAAAEVAVRAFWPEDPLPEPPAATKWNTLHRAASIPGLSFELSPDREIRRWGVAIRTNGFGMRDDEPLPLETPGVTRIAAVGDSFTFGYRVAVEDAYPARLEAALAEGLPDGARVDVLNFGVGGYSTRDEALVVEHKVVPWKPDVLVLGYALNDPFHDADGGLHEYFRGRRLWEHSHLLRKLHRRREWKGLWELGQGAHVRYHHEHPSRWQNVTRGFADIATVSEREGWPVLLVLFPVFYGGPWDEYAFADVHEKVTAQARASGFRVLDMRFVYQRSGHAPGELEVPGDGHPNPLGHRLAAEAIEAELRQMLPGSLFDRTE